MPVYLPRPIKLKLPTGIRDFFSYQTTLTASATAGTDSLTVKGIGGFAINQILLIGELGAEDSEIIKTHSSTAPTENTITLASNLQFTHPVYTKITVILYDQVEFSNSSTITGTKTTLTKNGPSTITNGLVSITGDSGEVRCDDTDYASGYYWMRYKNSINSVFSGYIGPEPYDGYEDNTVGKVIKKAMKRCHFEKFTDFIDYDFCLDEINECLRFISGKLKAWSKLQNFDYVLGQTTRGVNKYALPSDIYENENNKSILNVRLGKDIRLTWKNKTDWEEVMGGVIQTQVRTQATAGSTTLAIDNSYDFPDSGSVNVYISGEIYTLTYTGVTRSATVGVLTGIPASGTGAITVTIPVDTNVWYNESETKPTYYTVYGGYLYTELPQVTYLNKNIYLDYWTVPTRVDSDEDTLDVLRFDCCLHWLVWVINAQQKNKGKRDMNDADFISFLQILNDYIRTEIPLHRRVRKPKINSITYR